jgi:hypothetical protein
LEGGKKKKRNYNMFKRQEISMRKRIITANGKRILRIKASDLKKEASVDISIPGVDIQIEDLNDLCYAVSNAMGRHGLPLKFDNLTPDGNYNLAKDGIINLYTQHIPSGELDKYIQAVIYWIQDIGGEAEFIAKEGFKEKLADVQRQFRDYVADPRNKAEKEVYESNVKYYESYVKRLQEAVETNGDLPRVVRIKASIPKQPKDSPPPPVNLSNENANAVLGLLNYRFEEGVKLPIYELVGRIDRALATEIGMQEHTKETTREGNHVFIGRDVEYFKRKLNQIKKLAEWADAHGYRELIAI